MLTVLCATAAVPHGGRELIFRFFDDWLTPEKIEFSQVRERTAPYQSGSPMRVESAAACGSKEMFARNMSVVVR